MVKIQQSTIQIRKVSGIKGILMLTLETWLYLDHNTLSTWIFLLEEWKWTVPAVIWKVNSEKVLIFCSLLLLLLSLLFFQLFKRLETEALFCAQLMCCILIGARWGARGCIGPCVCCIRPCVTVCVFDREREWEREREKMCVTLLECIRMFVDQIKDVWKMDVLQPYVC